MSFALVELGLGSAGELGLTKFVDASRKGEDLLAELRKLFDWNVVEIGTDGKETRDFHE